jgi:hypothetical protein
MVWPMQTLNKMSLEVRRDISCSPDSVIELDLQALAHSGREPPHCGERVLVKQNESLPEKPQGRGCSPLFVYRCLNRRSNLEKQKRGR